MSVALKRVLRVRSLLESVSRIELERQVMRAAQIDEALRREAEASLRLRAESLAGILKSSREVREASSAVETAAEGARRSLAEIERQASVRRREQLERMASREGRRRILVQDEYLARRQEREQIEILLKIETERAQAEADRRYQRALDDWFAVARERRRRLEQKA